MDNNNENPQASQSQAAQPTVERLSNEEIDIIWATMPGGPAAWLKSFGYQQFAKAIEDEVIINHERAAHIAGTSQAPQSAADLADDDRYQHVRDILLDAMGAADVVNKSRLNMALDLLSDIAVAPKCAARPSQATKAQAKPIAYLRYWARQSWSGNGNHDVDHGDGFEVCKTGEVGDDGAPAFPVYAAPVAKEAPAVLEGWKLVPVEPTPEMLEESRGWLPVGARHHGLNVYRAMIAAAPVASVAKAETGSVQAEKISCPRCNGTGSVMMEGDCSDCNGKGYDWEPVEQQANVLPPEGDK